MQPNTINRVFDSSRGKDYSLHVNYNHEGKVSICVRGKSPAHMISILKNIEHIRSNRFIDNTYTTQNPVEMVNILENAIHDKIINEGQANTIKCLFSDVHSQAKKDPELEVAIKMSVESLQEELKKQLEEEELLAKALSESLIQLQDSEVEKARLEQQAFDLAMALSLADDAEIEEAKEVKAHQEDSEAEKARLEQQQMDLAIALSLADEDDFEEVKALQKSEVFNSLISALPAKEERAEVKVPRLLSKRPLPAMPNANLPKQPEAEKAPSSNICVAQPQKKVIPPPPAGGPPKLDAIRLKVVQKNNEHAYAEEKDDGKAKDENIHKQSSQVLLSQIKSVKLKKTNLMANSVPQKVKPELKDLSNVLNVMMGANIANSSSSSDSEWEESEEVGKPADYTQESSDTESVLEEKEVKEEVKKEPVYEAHSLIKKKKTVLADHINILAGKRKGMEGEDEEDDKWDEL